MKYHNRHGLYVEAWGRCLFVRTNTFHYDARHRPVRRPSVSIVVALNRPFQVRLPDADAPHSCQGIIIGPNVLREWIDAVDADLWVFDVTTGAPQYSDLLCSVKQHEVRELSTEHLHAIMHLCRTHNDMACVRTLLDSVVYSLCGRENTGPARDSRVAKVVSLVEDKPLDEWTVATLAAQVGMSVSRLRALFTQEMHCNPSYYLRMAALWKAVPLLEKGLSFTEAAHAVGFHDLSHFHRAVAEFTGLSPSQSRAIYGTPAMQLQKNKTAW